MNLHKFNSISEQLKSHQKLIAVSKGQDLEKIKHEKVLKILGPAILQPNLWHLNRKSVSRAIAIGLFCAFLPIPLQMVLAAFFAIIFAANLPISVILVWITNPITIRK